MLNSTANIYVSIGQALRQRSEESHGYRKPKHTYMISIETHKPHIPGLPQLEPAVKHFEAVRDVVTGKYGIAKHSSADSPGTIGSILVADSVHTSVDALHKTLRDKLDAETEADHSYGGDEDEHRVKTFIHALQDVGLVAKFRVDEFMLWTHSYLMDRLSNEAPALVIYPRAHRNDEQKASRRSFSCISHWSREKMRTHDER